MRDGLVYAAQSLCLGWIAVWASEILFWAMPSPDLGLLELGLTWAGYSVVSGAALSAVLWSGAAGWRAAFLGGALLGVGVEGALVATMYDAFPLQLVWTPLAWHALISGLAVLGGAFAFCRGGIARQAAWLLMLGLFGAGWGLYWPTEGKGPAGFGAVLAYQAGGGFGVGLALGVLTRLPAARQAAWWLWIAPLAVAALWVLGTALSPDMVRLAGPAMALATVWAMRRLGQ
ncbi:MAG: hypothetical protein MUE98_15340, partial [Rhodobacteraceae bacterium]|nr:hypothetical protein [Paracoccaceae bacterium]